MLKKFKDINFKILHTAIILIGLIYFVSYFFAFAKADGAEGIIFSIMTIPAVILGIPFFWLCTEVKILQDPSVYFVAIILDILIYALIIERLTRYFRNKKLRIKT